jgi:flagellar biosynthesis/type III secretory pathway M-ring protein FliF/YscJ
MATWIWIVIAVGAAIVLLALVFGARRGREQRMVQRREKAHELRQEAQRREQRAEEHSQQAREERRHAEAVGSRADELDPDRD